MLNKETPQPLSLSKLLAGFSEPSYRPSVPMFTSTRWNRGWSPDPASPGSHLTGGHPCPAEPLPGREAVLGFCGMVGRAARLGLGDCRRGFGLVGVLEVLRDLEPVSALGSALAFFSGVPTPKRLSTTPGCSLGTAVKMGTKSTLYFKTQR